MGLTLQEIYSEETDVHRRRYEEALEVFCATYGPGEAFFFRAPGRVNLIGEHTDYNHGFVMPVALDKDIVLVARPRSDNTVRLSNIESEFPPFSFAIDPDISPGLRGDWTNYAKGTARELARRLERDLHGMDGLVVGKPPFGVPREVGLSSSSAMTVVVAVALARLNGSHLAGARMAQICAEAEWFIGTRGGIMDHFISLLGQRDHALFLDCRPAADGRYKTEPIPLAQDYSILIADSGVRHKKVRGEYNQRVAACRAGVKLLQARFPEITHLRDVQEVPWQDFVAALPDQTTVGELTERKIDVGDVPGLTSNTLLKVRARCRHVWMENQRVQSTTAALRSGEVAAAGRLLNDAHTSARDDYEISCPELEILADTAREVDGVVGARLTGAGWGGCIVALVHNDAVSEFQAYVEHQYRARAGRPTAIFSCRTAPGASECFLS